jgi:hypothetical protein
MEARRQNILGRREWRAALICRRWLVDTKEFLGVPQDGNGNHVGDHMVQKIARHSLDFFYFDDSFLDHSELRASWRIHMPNIFGGFRPVRPGRIMWCVEVVRHVDHNVMKKFSGLASFVVLFEMNGSIKLDIENTKWNIDHERVPWLDDAAAWKWKENPRYPPMSPAGSRNLSAKAASVATGTFSPKLEYSSSNMIHTTCCDGEAITGAFGWNRVPRWQGEEGKCLVSSDWQSKRPKLQADIIKNEIKIQNQAVWRRRQAESQKRGETTDRSRHRGKKQNFVRILGDCRT